MLLEDELLQAARRAGERAAERQREADVARAEYHHAIRRLQLSGATMREIAAAVNLSHQWVQRSLTARAAGAAGGVEPPKRPRCWCARSAAPISARPTSLSPVRVSTSANDALKTLATWHTAGSRRLRAARLVAVGRRHATRCGFCGKDRTKVRHLITTDANDATVPRQAKYGIVSICNECLDLCADIIERPHRS
jgi:hypothetical protein